MKLKETFWLIGTVIFVIILNFYLFGVDGFKSKSVTDINVHDTYFVIANIHFILLLSILTFFSIYLIRMLKQNFKNITVNLIFILTGLLSVLFITGLISIVNSYIGVTQTTEYNLPVTSNMFDNVSTFLYLVQIIIIGLIAYCGFKTGQKYKLIK